MRIVISLIILLFAMNSHAIDYRVSFENRNSHYVDVAITLEVNKKNEVYFKMPVWAPGSYKLREFSQYVDFCSAMGDKNESPLKIEKTDKSTWKVSCKGQTKVNFSYRIYAFEQSVRQSYCDQYYAFLHGTSAFMYVQDHKQEAIKLSFNLPQDWKDIEVALPKIDNDYSCANYDELADSPIALGNFESTSFISQNVPHKVVMIGKGNYDLEKIKTDFTKICDEAGKVIGTNPCNQYIHFIQNIESGGGGLEHANCQTSQMQRWAYTDEAKYKSFLGLIAHEYFHLWNVKRLRPMELGPFDYDKEVYTKLLWISEGFTAYYDDLFLKRAGYYTQEEYTKIIASTYNRVANTYGSKVSSLSESSYNAWVKSYLANENTNNITISYYSKGMLVALLIDLNIRKITANKKTLDDLMKELYNKFYIKEKRGFTEEEFYACVVKLTNAELVKDIKTWVNTTLPLPIDANLASVGLELIDKTKKDKPYWGINYKDEAGKITVSFVELASVAATCGLSVNDELIAINNIRVNSNIAELIKQNKVGTPVQLTVSRNGFIVQLQLVPESNKQVDYEVAVNKDANADQKEILKNWLNNQ
jgi:predicted metalloprotease with PDZ domain